MPAALRLIRPSRSSTRYDTSNRSVPPLGEGRSAITVPGMEPPKPAAAPEIHTPSGTPSLSLSAPPACAELPVAQNDRRLNVPLS